MRDIVPSEIAAALKRLEFDEPCFGYYFENALHIEKYFFNEQNLNSIFQKWENIEPKVSAPTFSQAFRFFRKRGWYFDIYQIEDHWEYYVQHQSHSWIQEGFKDDDFCELACLERLIDLEMVRLQETPPTRAPKPKLTEEKKLQQLNDIFDSLNDES